MIQPVVVKFGGTSLQDFARINKCCDIVVGLKKNNNVVVVVSAMGGTTNQILTNISSTELEFFPSICEDLILSTGESTAAGYFSAFLSSKGVSSLPLCGWQIPILTKNKLIEKVCTDKIDSLLNQNITPVVTGFQGVDSTGHITTLSRGGSDTTAAALAHALGSKSCYIYTDVAGVYRINPNISGTYSNKIIKEISYNDMYYLASNGAKVIHKDALEFGRTGNFDMFIRSSLEPAKKGTRIANLNKSECGISINQRGNIYLLHNQLLDEKHLSRFEEYKISQNELELIDLNNETVLSELCQYIADLEI